MDEVVADLTGVEITRNRVSSDELLVLRRDLLYWLHRWKYDPLAYVIECVGDTPTHQQAEILKAFRHHNFVAVRSGHGIGKSKLVGWLVNWWLDTRGKRAPITGAGGDQLYDIVFPEVVAVCKKKMKWLSNKYDIIRGEVRLKSAPELCKAILRTARIDNADALQGFHDCMFFIDEGSGVRDEIFEVASGAMGDEGAYGLMTGNPTKLSGYFYRVFHSKTFWFPMHFSSADSLAEKEYSYTYTDHKGNVKVITTRGRQTSKWVEDMANEYGRHSNAFKVRVLGEFATLGSDLIVPERFLDCVYDLGRFDTREKMTQRIMGIDPAWTGDDDTGVVIREGRRVLYAESWHGQDTVETFNRCKVLFHDWKCDKIMVDTIGVGAGVYDNFRHAIYKGKLGYPVYKVAVSTSSPDDNCKNLRDWLWWKCREFFKNNKVYFADNNVYFEQLFREIIQPTYKIVNGKIVAESKDDLRKRGVRSPNIADALNLTFFGDSDTFKQNYYLPERYKKKKKKALGSWKVT